MPVRNACCTFCVKSVQWLPVIFVVCIITWSYYAYVFALCIITIQNVVQKVVYLVFYHVFLVFFFWSYYQTIFTAIGRVPREFYLPASEIDRLEREDSEDRQRQILARSAQANNLPIQLRAISGAIRYCEKCKLIKPDRCHHCSVCGTCVLKMDHHCPWVNNCVNFTNYKFFILFLGYSLLYCLYVSATSLEYFIKFWTNELEGPEKFHILFLFFVSVMFAISLISLFSYHLYLVAKNRSTLESFRVPMFRTGPDKDGFDLGMRKNVEEVFGDNTGRWLLPVTTYKGNGYKFPSRHTQNSYNSMDSTPNPATTNAATADGGSLPPQLPSKGDGISYPVRMEDNEEGSLLQRQRWAEEAEQNGPGYGTEGGGSPHTNVTFTMEK